MSIFNDYQVVSLVSEEFVPNEQSAVVSTSPKRKWLNIALDINDILCHCMEKKATNRMPFVNSVQQWIHLSMVPTIIRLKAIFMRPSLHEFFTMISKFAVRVIIWSSMKRSTVQKFVHYLFCGLPQPFEVLRQDNCRKIEIYQGKYLTIINGSKEIFFEVSNLTKKIR